MKRKVKASRCGVIYPHRIECAINATAHAMAAAVQLAQFLQDQQRPSMAPEVNRFDVAENELDAACAWVASARRPVSKGDA
jgi:hypothetical protein